jgi:hypothetical protein
LILIATGALAFVLSACEGDGAGSATPTMPATSTTAASTPPPTLPPGTVEPSPTPGPGEPATIELSADPQTLVCDGERASRVTARVLNVESAPVADGTVVRFSVVTLGTADPIDATTTDGVAETSVVALGSQVGVVVNVTAGEVQRGIRIDCQ